MQYRIWSKRDKNFIDSMKMPDGETLNLALTPDGRIIQYGNYTDYQAGEIPNPEKLQVLYLPLLFV